MGSGREEKKREEGLVVAEREREEEALKQSNGEKPIEKAAARSFPLEHPSPATPFLCP